MRVFRWTAFAVLLTAAGGLASHRSLLRSELLRADPDAIPADSRLMAYALPPGGAAFRARCRGCHGVAGSGDTSRGIPDLSDTDWLYGDGSVSDIERTVSYGIRSRDSRAWNLADMPAFAHPRPSATNAGIAALSPGGIHDVIEYLVSLQNRPADAEAGRRGAKLYLSNGACYDCHSPDARGDSAIGAPNLADDVNLYGDGSRGALFDSISNGRGGVCPGWLRTLGAVEVREIALYVYSLSHPPVQQPRRPD